MKGGREPFCESLEQEERKKEEEEEEGSEGRNGDFLF